MKEFFRGWRRKCGTVTLLLACLLMGAWIRGAIYFDKLVVPHGKSYSVFWSNSPTMASCLGLGWSHYWIDPSEGRYKIPGMRWESNPTYTNERIRELKRAKALEKQSQEWTADGNWEWESLGFLARTNREFLLLAVPYWSIVIPLTAVSAYLLLAKPK